MGCTVLHGSVETFGQDVFALTMHQSKCCTLIETCLQWHPLHNATYSVLSSVAVVGRLNCKIKFDNKHLYMK